MADPEVLETIRLPGPLGKMVTLNVVYDVSDPCFNVRLLVLPNRLKAFLEYQLLDPSALPSVNDLMDLLNGCGIIYGIHRDSLMRVIEHISQDRSGFGPIEVAAGDIPEPGRDGFVDWFVAPSSRTARYKTDTQGNIDYFETNLIENAYAQGRVAHLRKPTAGTPGKDIFGEEIPTRPGKAYTVRLGPNIHFDDDAEVLIAEVDGRVVVEGNHVSVSQKYVVKGDVDLSVGHIDFVGDVEVQGNIPDGFTVIGRRGLTVQGVVGAAHLESDGDIVIHGGVAGKGKALIRSSHGRIEAKYINEATVETQGNVVVRNEVVNSTIRTSGILTIPGGSIIGGEVCALQGIEVKTLGSSLGVATRVDCGLDWQAEIKLQEAERIIQIADSSLSRLRESLDILMRSPDHLRMCNDDGRRLLRQVHELLVEIQEKREVQAELRDLIQATTRDDAIYQINVLSQLYHGCVIRLGQAMGQIRSALSGPISVVRESHGDAIKSISMEKMAKPRAVHL